MDCISVRGAREHNLQEHRPRRSPATSWWSSPASRARASRRWPSTPSTPRGSGATSSRSRPTPGSSSQQMEKPDVDSIEGLSPAITIEQKTAAKNPRSTVGTVTEIYDYLRLLYRPRRRRRTARAAAGRSARRRSQQIVDRILRACPRGRASSSTPPSCAARRASTRSSFEQMARKAGFVRARVDGKAVELADEPPDARQAEQALDRDRHRPPRGQAGGIGSASPTRSRRRSRWAGGLVVFAAEGAAEETPARQNYACTECGTSFDRAHARASSPSTAPTARARPATASAR